MRLRPVLAAGAVSAALAPVILAGQPPARVAEPPPFARAAPGASALPVAATQQPSCGDARSTGFPISTKVLTGPVEYRAGAGAQEFTVGLTNTTAGACRNVHPVVVLTGRDQALAPDHIRMEFYDGAAGTWRPVVLVPTDQGEAVGAFGAEPGTGFAGFALAGHEVVTVRVRLAFLADAHPGSVVANAAVVQRRGADGDWVGESDDYRFSVIAAGAAPRPSTSSREPGGDPDGRRTPPPAPHELAATGIASRYAIGLPVAACALLIGAVALRSAARRFRSGGSH
ncbi:hypothetical protein ACFXOS_10610 [Streptomyces sp. NPDC059175]|uniref:hypothetical protein n=1 Tax=Streptomyces sp. NPDC059175 TaxID=3346757 RepID=UPI0036C6406D